MGHQERRDFSSRAESILEAMAIARATGEKSVLSVSCVRSVVKIRLRSVAQTAGLTPEDTQLIRWVAWADASAAPRTTKAVRLSRPGRGRPRSGRERVVSDWHSAGACLPHPPPSASTSPGTGEVNLPERPTARSRFFHSKPRADTNVTKRQPGTGEAKILAPSPAGLLVAPLYRAHAWESGRGRGGSPSRRCADLTPALTRAARGLSRGGRGEDPA